MKHIANSNSKSCYFNGKFSQFLVYIALFPSFTSSGLAVSKYLKTIIKTTEDSDTLLATKTIPRSLLWIQFPRQSVVTSCLNWYTTWRHVKNLNNQNSTHHVWVQITRWQWWKHWWWVISQWLRLCFIPSIVRLHPTFTFIQVGDVRRFQGCTRSGQIKRKSEPFMRQSAYYSANCSRTQSLACYSNKDKTEACSLKSVCPENLSWHQHIVSWNSHTELLESVRRRVRKLFHSVWPSGVFGAKENTLFHSTTQMSGLLKAITQKTACWVLMPHTHTTFVHALKKTVNHIQLISLVRWSSVCPQTGRPGLSNRLRAGNYIPYSTKSLPKTELQGTNSVFCYLRVVKI